MTLTLKEAITAIQSGDTALGKKLLAQLLLQNPDDDMAWIWMSATVDEPEQRHYCLQKALEINPANATARAGMARLGLELPDAPPPPPALARVDHALGIPDVPPEGSPAQTPAFFWPPRHEASEEAPIVEETFIGDIVAAMNKDETGAPAPADTELDWLFQPDAAESAAERETEQGLRAMFSSLGDGALGDAERTGRGRTCRRKVDLRLSGGTGGWSDRAAEVWRKHCPLHPGNRRSHRAARASPGVRTGAWGRADVAQSDGARRPPGRPDRPLSDQCQP